MLVVAALGGNALARRGDPPDIAAQRARADAAATALATVAAGGHLVVTHGNGPQVGRIALRHADAGEDPPPPLDVLDAESAGQIGYLVVQALANRLPGREVVALLTRVVVDPADSAFGRPDKPIGPVYTAAVADRLARMHGWAVGPDGDGFRRLVPSPEPLRIVELPAIRALVAADTITVCVGGGGIPVVEAPDGTKTGVEAVIDKDLASALLAIALDADALLLLTDVPAVFTGWGGPAARAIRSASPGALGVETFAPGSMAPKITAACRFAAATGRAAVIGRLEDAAALLDGGTGTAIRDDGGPLSWWT